MPKCIDCNETFNYCIKYKTDSRCEDCMNHSGLIYCEGCGEWNEPNDIVIDEFCEPCANDHDYFQCLNCNEWCSNDDSNWYNEEHYCNGCFDCLNIVLCHGCGEWKEPDDILDCDCTSYCGYCANSRGWFCCHHCNAPSADTISEGCDNYCEDCFNTLFFICAGCSDIFVNDDCVYTDEGLRCQECAPLVDTGDCAPRFTYMKENNYSEVGSDRRYGIELESSRCHNYTYLNRSGWGAKYDASITGKEFYSAIFRGNKGLDSIRAVCQYAHNHEWTVDTCCGYHLHLNMHDETPDTLKAIAYAYYSSQKVWCTFVAGRRLGGSYSQHLPHDIAGIDQLDTLEAWRTYGLHRDRGIWVNWCAYRQYRSLEIRLHEGTFDADKVCNWVKAHTTFVDWASNTGYNDVKEIMAVCDIKDLLTNTWKYAGCGELAKYYGIQELVTA